MNAQSDDSDQFASSDQASDLKAKPFGQEEFLTSVAPLILRLALAVTILSAVADRFGVWGPPGATNVAWGDWPHFVAYTAKVNRFLPEVFAPALAVTATGAEGLLGLALILGIFPRPVAWASAALLGLFAVAMTLSLGIKAPLNYSVFADAAAALFSALGPSQQGPNPLLLGDDEMAAAVAGIRFSRILLCTLDPKLIEPVPYNAIIANQAPQVSGHNWQD
jgi:putative oxidoreductase